MASANIAEVNDESFQSEVLDAGVPVLVDFWAEWCMPCRLLVPTIEEIAGEFDGRAKVAKLDTDKAMETARKFQISAIPTVIIFSGGEAKRKFVGVTSAGDLRNALNEVLEG